MFFNGVVNAANKKCAILVEDPGLHVKDRRTKCVCVWGRLKVLTSPLILQSQLSCGIKQWRNSVDQAKGVWIRTESVERSGPI